MARIHTKPNPGGYVNIKLGGVYLYDGGDPVIVDGVHAKIVEAMKIGKPIYISDFYTDDGVNTAPASPVLIAERNDENSFVGYFSIGAQGYYQIYIVADDSVTLSYVPYIS